MTTALDDRLRDLGTVLAIDGDDAGELIRSVLARIDEPESPSTDRSASRPGVRSAIRIAAVVVVLVAAAVAAVPSSRRAVADWFGFDGARIERQSDLPVPAEPDPIDPGADGDTVGTVVDIGNDEVLVSEFVGTLDNPALVKVAGDGTRVQQVTVHGEVALWIDGEPHEVSFLDERGEIVVRRFAGNTLLWQDGPLIRRVEGFSDVDAAIDYAESFGT